LKFLIFFLLFTYSERDFLNDFHSAIESPVSDFLMNAFSRSADDEALVIEYVGFFTFDESPNHRDSKALFVGGILTSVSVSSLKWITNRERPSGPTKRLNSSFPSGHAAMAFFLSTYLSKRYPKWRIPLYIWATGVGLSRMYLKSHWPSDVVFGALLGTFWATVIYKNLHFFGKR
jgi:hypothetical protein